MVYSFTNQTLAEDALIFIDIQIGYPIKGINALTGLEVDGADTITWAEIEQRKDNNFSFVVVESAIFDNFSQIIKDQFDTNFPHVIEERDLDAVLI